LNIKNNLNLLKALVKKYHIAYTQCGKTFYAAHIEKTQLL